MTKRFFCATFLIGILLAGCLQPKTKMQELSDKGSFFIADSMSIPIPEDVSYRAYMSQVTQNHDSLFLLRENWIKNAIDIIDLKNGKYLRSIMFLIEGPNSLKLYSFYYHNQDSIFCVPFMGTELFAYNVDGDFLFKRKLSVEFKHSEPVAFSPTNQSPPFFLNSVLSFSSTSYVDYRYEPDKYYSDNFCLNYNVAKDSIWVPSIYFPHSYHKNIYPITKIYRTLNHKTNQFINSFSYSHYLYISDYSSLVDSVLVQSKYLDEIPSFTKYEEANRGRDCFVEKMYADIIYDKYRDVYYRFVALVGEEQFLNKVDIANQYLYRSFVVMLLDSNFKVLDEIKMPMGIYNYYDYFVNEQGLWISTNNPENNSFNENFLRYQLLKLKKS